MANRLNLIFLNGAKPPHTNKDAIAVDEVNVQIGTRVIHVVGANYRRATLTGSFQVKTTGQIYFTKAKGYRCIEIECIWYNWQPPKKKSLRLILWNNEVDTVANSIVECISVIGVT